MTFSEKLIVLSSKFSIEVLMEIRRDSYLEKIESLMWNGQVKVITGIRRCGKSYLLNPLFCNYLLSSGVKSENIIVRHDITKRWY